MDMHLVRKTKMSYMDYINLSSVEIADKTDQIVNGAKEEF